MSAIEHFTEYRCDRCKGIERTRYSAAPPAGWRWLGRGHQQTDLFQVRLLCGHCDRRLDSYLDGHPINEGEGAVDAKVRAEALESAAREAEERGDIGKDGGPEAWDWLRGIIRRAASADDGDDDDGWHEAVARDMDARWDQ